MKTFSKLRTKTENNQIIKSTNACTIAHKMLHRNNDAVDTLSNYVSLMTDYEITALIICNTS